MEKNCEQVKESDLIIWEKDKELESLKKQLEAKDVMVELPEQSVMEQSNRVSVTKVEGLLPTTLSMQRNTLLQLSQPLPVITSRNPVVNLPQSEPVTTSSQRPDKLRGQPLPQSYRETREYVPRRVTVTSSWAPRTLSNPLQDTRQINPLVTSSATAGIPLPVPSTESSVQSRGKAPPIDSFTGEDNEIRFDDWLPTLERAVAWNEWTENEKVIQLAGYLRGRALQEWNLITTIDYTTYQSAVVALRTWLDPGNKTLAALDFRHIIQKETESLSDFIRRLECIFQIAFGHDPMSAETKDVLLYGKLQDGLRIDQVNKAPAISGARSYQELCIAAKTKKDVWQS